ncbi:UNVERIFIED_CONTAM: NADH dehydrogenase [ubiquinone] iron-sulfur protein 5-A [Sesamum calycinum]|uniref:NADH dehydrogenase [ubiquinone] iron-sulfur protein 5 n=1 Tax=Sesamum calycinum TaxID=2727403 RepID=A0AAW2L9H8_9LAMI
MASGWGITGNKGRCYDFWMDFSDCMSRCREPKDCALLREDYLECLHHSKEDHASSIAGFSVTSLMFWSSDFRHTSDECQYVFQRRNRVYKEEQRQLRAAAEKGKGGGEDVHH